MGFSNWLDACFDFLCEVMHTYEASGVHPCAVNVGKRGYYEIGILLS